MSTFASATQIHELYGRLSAPGGAWLDSLVTLHETLLDEAAAHHQLGWRPAGGENFKYRYPIDRERLRRFANFAYGGIGFEEGNDFLGARPTLDDPAPEIAPSQAVVLESRKRILEWIGSATILARGRFPAFETEWAALLHEPADIGGVYLDIASATPPIRVSNHSARVSWRAPTLAAWLGRPPASLLEIGGGHGKFLRDCALLMPDTRLFLTDLPFNLIVQARYLTEYFGDQVNLCLTGDQVVDPAARINLVAPWLLDRIPGPVEVAANFLSFQHMDAANLQWYGAAIEGLGAACVFHLNRATSRDPHDFAVDDYPFRKAFRIVERDEQPLGTVRHPDGRQGTVNSVLELLVKD